MLPAADHGPSGLRQGAVDLLIALDVAAKLRSPELVISLRHGGVLGALMPEASVHEHCQSGRRERYVGANGKVIEFDAKVLPETEAAAMKLRAEGSLRPGVDAAVGNH